MLEILLDAVQNLTEGGFLSTIVIYIKGFAE